MEKSRLKNNLEKKAIQNIILAILGVVVIFVFLFIFGQKILIGLGLLAGKVSHGDTYTTNVTQQPNYIEPPTLNPTVDATNSATISITGSASSNETVSLYNNGSLVDKKTVASGNNFTFTDVTLNDGDNAFKAKITTTDNKESDYSNEILVNRLNKAPKLDISSPSDNEIFKKDQSPIQVTGNTDPNVKVTVNEFWAIVNGQGNYTYSYNLHDGDNAIKIEATDQAGNKTSKQITIHVQ